MEKILLLILVTLVFNTGNAQVTSSCNVPQILAHEYERDIKNLTIRRLYQLQSPDTFVIRIPQTWQDTIAEGLAAIFNATSIPERDSIFNLYCVHDNTTPYQIYNELLVQVDTNYAWTQPWQNLNAITGNAYIDSIMIRYHYSVTQFFNWSIGNYALLRSDSLWNIYAIIDTLQMIPGVVHAEPNSIIGAAGKMDYHVTGTDRYYDFYFEFNDCFDGCDNWREWQYVVHSDCSVDYLGFIDWGVFGISPLPAPVNCNTFTVIQDNNPTQKKFNVFPNPATSIITIQSLNNNQLTDVLIYDVNGKVILAFDCFFGSVKLNLAHLPDGIYSLIILQQKQQIEIHRVIKN